MSEPTKPAAPKLVPVRAPDGSVGTVPESELSQAIEAGAEIVSDDVLKRAKLEVDYGGIGGEALAAGAGAARGLTFGLSDAALTGLDPSLRDPLNALREVNPNASLAGEIAGAVAPTLFTGGGSAGLSVGGAVRGLGAIPRGVSALGGLAERGAARLVGEGATGLLGAAAQRGVALGARGLFEGGAYGAGHEISEAALGDYEVTAQKLIAGARGGALAGLAIGGGLGALEGAGSAAIGKIRGQLDAARARRGRTMASEADVLPGEPPPSIVEKYANQFENGAQLADAWKDRAKLFAKHDDAVEEATRNVTKELTDAVKAENVVDHIAFGEAKAGQMAKLVTIGETPAARIKQAQAAFDAMDRVKERVAWLDSLPTKGGSEGAVSKMKKWVAQQDGEIRKAWETSANPADMFMALDDMKRAVGKRAGFGKQAFRRTDGENEFGLLYEDLRQTLENESTWGAAGAAQRDVNVATTERLGQRDLFQQKFLQQYGSTAGSPEFVADPAKVKAFVAQLTSAQNDLTHQTVKDYIRNEAKFLDSVEKHYTLSASEKASIAQARKSFKAIEKAVGETAESVSKVNAAKRLIEEERAFAIGGITGAVVDVFTKPMTTLARLADAEKAVQSLERRLDKGVGVFFKKPLAPVPLDGKAKPVRESYARRTAELTDMMADPSKVAAKAADQIGDFADHAPNVSAAAAGIEAKKVAFLQSKLPPGHKPMDGLSALGAKPRVSEIEMARFMRYARAVDDPMSVVADLEHGKVSREAVEAIREVYPAIFESIRARVTEHLATAKGPIPYQKKLQLGLLFGAPTHPSLEPAFIRLMQEQWSGKQQQPKAIQGGRSFALPAVSQATSVDRLEGQ